MQYLLLCRFNEDDWNAIPEAKRDTIMEAYHGLLDELREDGRHVATAKLDSIATGRTVRHDGDGPTTDGPFVETKEHLGGYHLIEAESLEEATAVAGRLPTIPHGGVVEVRPVLDMR
ncbi:MAG: YciI family protein [Gemmatimonadota bacterium]